MTLDEESVRSCLERSGGHDIAGRAAKLCAEGDRQGLVRLLRVKRCELLERIHGEQRKIDRLDYLIRAASGGEPGEHGGKTEK